MPIVDLQRRLREAGRIRLGDKGGRNGAPRKLTTFRLTGPDRTLIEAAAAVFGGTVEAWPEMDAQWQVTTEATSLDVIIPPTEMAHSVWYEQWSGGGCKRRCDGTWDTIEDRACDCNPEDRACKPHTRISVMLTALPGIGVWRLDTQGWNAATELQGAVDLIQQVGARGTLLPARLLMVRREQKLIVDGKPQTRKFVVPALDVDVQMTSLAGGVSALPAGPGFTPVPPSLESGPTIADQVAPPAPRVPRKNAAAPIPGSGKSRRKSTDDAPSPSSVGEVVEPASDAESLAAPTSHEHTNEEKARASRVAMMCADRGIDTDDARHDFLLAFSEGAYSSSYEVTADAMPALRAALVKWTRKELVVVDGVLVKTSNGLAPEADPA